ncbi:MAG: hypothetical protein ACM3TR_12840 [Caulobacteraceae bacterium]
MFDRDKKKGLSNKDTSLANQGFDDLIERKREEKIALPPPYSLEP